MKDKPDRDVDVATADPRDIAACDGCGVPTHVDLLDAKPDDPSSPESCDWTRLECRSCHGRDWVPALESQWPLRDRVVRALQRRLRAWGLPYGRYARGALG
jgi:hypothetical protein